MATNVWVEIPGAGSGGAGVDSLNGLTGPVTLLAGTGIAITPGVGTITIDNTGSNPVGTPNTFAGYDGSGNLFTIPNWNIDTDTGGANVFLNLTPTDPGGGTNFNLNNFQNSITPTNDLTNLSFNGLQNYTALNGPFNQSNFVGFSNGVQTNDIGNKGIVIGMASVVSLGDGTNASSSEQATLLQGNININSGQTVNQNAILLDLNITTNNGSSVQNINMGNFSANVNDVVTNNIRGIGVFPNVNFDMPANVGVNVIDASPTISNLIQYLSGFGFQAQFNNGATVTNSVQAHEDNGNLNSGATASQGWISYSAFPNFHSGSTINGYQGVVVSPNIDTAIPNQGYNGYSANGQFTANMQFFNGYSLDAQFNAGSSVTNGIQGYGFNPHLSSTSSVNFMTGLGIYGNLDSGSTTGSYQGVNINPSIHGTITNNVTLLEVNINGGASIPQLRGIDIDLNQVTSPQQKQGLNINDGTLNVQSNYDTSVYPASPGFINLIGLGGLFTVAAGHPVTNTLTLANNYGSSAIFMDNYGPDPFVGTLGFANLAFVNQLSVGLGKTVSNYNQQLIASSVPDLSTEFPGYVDGGTISNYYSLRIAGLLLQGGNVSVTNQYQIYMDNIGGASSASNAWGLYIADPALQNYFKSSLAIDTASFKVSNSSVGLEIGGNTKALRLSNLTTTERDALTALAGMEIFNTTTNEVEFYDGTSWTSGGGGGGANTALSNLAATSINQDLIASSDDTNSIGSSSKIWNTGYFHILSGNGPSINLVGGNLRNGSFATLMNFSGSDPDFNSRRLVNAADPTSAQDVATKNYVDTKVTGASGTFTTADAKTVTVVNGLITSIV